MLPLRQDFTHSKQMHPAVASDVPYLDPSGARYDGDSTMEKLGALWNRESAGDEDVVGPGDSLLVGLDGVILHITSTSCEINSWG